MRRRDSDRRKRPRFEIVGELWGTFEASLWLPIRDIGPNGALLASHVPLAMDAVYSFAYRGDGATQVRVRHMRQVNSVDGEQSFLVGVQFLSCNAVLLEELRSLAGDPERGAAFRVMGS